MAPEDPKPIPPAFRDAIFSTFRPPLYPHPSDPTKRQQRANELVWKFHEHTIYQVHGWLEAHDVYGAPDWQGHDPLKNERILIDALEHLSALLNFIGIRTGERSKPDVQVEGPGRRQRKQRGRPRDTDVSADEKVHSAWQSGSYRSYAELASALGLPEREVGRALDRYRKRLSPRKRAGKNQVKSV
ncbi:MAG: hypothetical protein ACYC3I_17195 [Gemmataceae bacterium]